MKEFTLVLTEAEINTLAQLLMQAPWSVANPMILKIQEQVRDQQTVGEPVESNRD